MLDHIVEQARQQQIFCRERTAVEQCVLGAFLYHAGQSYRKITEFIDRSHVAVHDWYHRLAPLFEPDPGHHEAVAIDETKLFVEDREVYVWAVVDVDTFEVVHVEVTAGRSSLDAMLFFRTVLERCRGQPLLLLDRGPWYDWAVEQLDCEVRRETFGDRSLVEAWFSVLKYRTLLFWHRFPHRSSVQSTDRWARAFALIHNALLQS